LEKRISKIQKWLDRCLEACRAKSWDNALADMECANAELRNAREKLWEEIANQAVEKPGFLSRSMPALRTGVLVAVILITSAVPLSVNNAQLRRDVAGNEEKLVLEWVKSDEHKLLMALRESLSENSFRQTLYTDQGPAEKSGKIEPEVSVTGSAAGKISSTDEQKRLQVKENVQKQKPELPVEEVIALIQIGERSLRDPGSAIEIKK